MAGITLDSASHCLIQTVGWQGCKYIFKFGINTFPRRDKYIFKLGINTFPRIDKYISTFGWNNIRLCFPLNTFTNLGKIHFQEVQHNISLPARFPKFYIIRTPYQGSVFACFIASKPVAESIK